MDASTLPTDALRDFTYLKTILPLLSRLHEHGCDRDRGHNRKLHYDQYAALILLYFFNPIITSLRGLQDATTLSKVQGMLGIKPTSLGALSEAATVFDPTLLTEIIGEIGAQLRPPAPRPPPQ